MADRPGRLRTWSLIALAHDTFWLEVGVAVAAVAFGIMVLEMPGDLADRPAYVGAARFAPDELWTVMTGMGAAGAAGRRLVAPAHPALPRRRADGGAVGQASHRLRCERADRQPVRGSSLGHGLLQRPVRAPAPAAPHALAASLMDGTAGLPAWLGNWPVWAVLALVCGMPAFRTLSALIQWTAGFLAGRQDARVQVQTNAHQQFEAARAALVSQLQTDLDRGRAIMDGYEAELAKLRRSRALFADAMVDLRTAALSARAMVHELERRLGEPATVFTPLPTIDEDTPMRN